MSWLTEMGVFERTVTNEAEATGGGPSEGITARVIPLGGVEQKYPAEQLTDAAMGVVTETLANAADCGVISCALRLEDNRKEWIMAGTILTGGEYTCYLFPFVDSPALPPVLDELLGQYRAISQPRTYTDCNAAGGVQTPILSHEAVN